MEASQFDELTKVLASGTSRRRAIKLLGAGLGGTVLALFGLRTSPVLAECDCATKYAQAVEYCAAKNSKCGVKNFRCPIDHKCRALFSCSPCASS